MTKITTVGGADVLVLVPTVGPARTNYFPDPDTKNLALWSDLSNYNGSPMPASVFEIVDSPADLPGGYSPSAQGSALWIGADSPGATKLGFRFNDGTLVPGLYTFSCFLTINHDYTIWPSISFQGTGVTPKVKVPANALVPAWTRELYTFTVDSADYDFYITITNLHGFSQPSDGPFYVTGLLLELVNEPTVDQLGSYFSGASANGADTVYSWSGAENASPSYGGPGSRLSILTDEVWETT